MTRYNRDVHHRGSIRLPGYDYSEPGAYFVTICTHERQCWFGDVKNGKLQLRSPGTIVQTTWLTLPKRFPFVVLDEFVVMPNHFRGIISLVGAQFIAPASNPTGVMNHAPTLGECVRAFKAMSTRLIHRAGLVEFGWQQNYYEHVVRSEAELNRIREYIQYNPQKWEEDEENPSVATKNVGAQFIAPWEDSNAAS